MSSADELIVHLDVPLPDRMSVGRGQVLYVSGRCYHPEQTLRTLELTVDDVPHVVTNHSSVRTDVPSDDPAIRDRTPNSLTSGFWAVVPVPSAVDPRLVRIGCRAELTDGTRRAVALGEIRVEGELPSAATARAAASRPAQVVICLATYNPDPELFRQQVASIVAQDHPSWCCIVSDDGSTPERARLVHEVAARDRRFRVIGHPTRVGHYDNVARALTAVPADAEFVALCDQDDVWHPERLSRAIAAFTPETTLVYGDMGIAAGAGARGSSTYPTMRRNDSTDLAALLFANTVTSAASTFRASLLADVLPFPPRIGDAFHDHWIACVALATGRLGYVDHPLYASRQRHENENALGHWAKPPPRLLSRLGDVERALLRPHRRRRFMASLWRLRDVYACDVVRLIVIAKLLQLRLGDAMTPEKRAVVDRIADLERAPGGLVRELVLARRDRRPTLGAEWHCLRGFLASRLLDVHYRRDARRLFAQRQARRDVTGSGPVPSALAGVDLIERKLAPLTLRIDDAAPRRVNLLAPSIDFAHLFAGYFGKLHLALRLADAGHRVRLVVVDAGPYDPPAWQRSLASYPGLERLFDRVEIVDASDRSVPLVVGSGDAFVATTWWTAHLAHGASRALGRSRFLYLIQEYEPMTFPMGSLHALASASYELPHVPLFSTEMLRDWFRERGIGVFAHGGESFTFQNAIARFSVTAERLRRPGPRKLLFYARPEQHAARNMFELGVLGLRAACAEGVFDAWVIDGVGAGRPFAPVPLSAGQRMQLLPRVSLAEYQLLLPGYDVGLSLMLTPHPSLVPLEMAAAGLVTVTNTYANKSEEALRALSGNLVPVPPTLAGIGNGLREAARRSSDLGARAAGANVAWSRDWSTSFDDDLVRRLSDVVRSA